MNLKKHIRMRKRSFEEFSETEKQAYLKLLQRVEENERQEKIKVRLTKADELFCLQLAERAVAEGKAKRNSENDKTTT